MIIMITEARKFGFFWCTDVDSMVALELTKWNYCVDGSWEEVVNRKRRLLYLLLTVIVGYETKCDSRCTETHTNPSGHTYACAMKMDWIHGCIKYRVRM
jgi:hypothetical protein